MMRKANVELKHRYASSLADCVDCFKMHLNASSFLNKLLFDMTFKVLSLFLPYISSVIYFCLFNVFY